ncbi:MAG: CDP-diacylglycerol--serine O-phosphatidyltransferase [Candidatus Njordarchaeota archaeon]
MSDTNKGGMRLFLTIPNVFTLSNLGFGFLAIYLAVSNELLYAFIAILIAVLCDGLDGFVARKMNAANEFGRELDSLCDEVSFGIAPAMMLICSIEDPALKIYALLAGVIYSAFGALRLARFNIYGSKEFFEGLAIPAAAFFSGLTILCIVPMYPQLGIVIIFVTAVLMITSISFPSTKTKVGVKSVIISLLIGVLYFVVFSIISLIPDILRAILWLLFSLKLAYITVSPFVFRKLTKH